jgi:hypothetical protein
MLRAARRMPMRYPFFFGVGLSTVKNGGADVLVQSQVEGVPLGAIDWRRTSVFAAFGCVFCGAWQYVLFVKTMPVLCPSAVAFAAKPLRAKLRDGAGLRQLCVQVFVENGLNNPLLYWPIFYSIKTFIEQPPGEKYSSREIVARGIARYSETWREDILSIWKVWIPAQIVNFAFCPLWARVPFVASVSFFWTCYVSLVRGAPEDSADSTASPRGEQ